MSNSVTTAPFRYAELRQTPKGYECGVCGANGVKLWREWNTFLNYQTLYCETCARGGDDQPAPKPFPGMERSDQIIHPTKGTLAPAVPTQDGESYWGYTSVPEVGCVWWKSLPRVKGENDWPDSELLRDAGKYHRSLEFWNQTLANPELSTEAREFYNSIRQTTIDAIAAVKNEMERRKAAKEWRI